MIVKATELRKNLYKLLDRVAKTGEPLEVERNGGIIRISAVPKRFDASKLVPHPDAVTGDPDDLIHMDWSSEWKPFL